MNIIIKNLIAAAMICFSSVAISAEHPAQALIIKTVDNLLKVIREDGDRIRKEPEYLRKKLDDIVVPHLDFETMTKRSIGKNWKKATAKEKQTLVAEYKEFMLKTYTGAVTEYQDGIVSYAPFRPEKKETRAVVRSTFKQSGTGDVPVVYKLWENDGAWKVWDVEVSQLSLVTNNRSFFNSEIERNGIKGLIQLLKEKNGS